MVHYLLYTFEQARSSEKFKECMMNSKKTFPNPPQESYTKFPNRYNDIISPSLTNTQRDVCDVVIRQTYGWQKEQARIPNKTFVAKSGKSERSIITAKKQLIDIGLLVMLEAPRGTRAGLYKLDLYYMEYSFDDHPKVQMTQKEAPPQEILPITDPTPKNDIVEIIVNEIPVETSTNEPVVALEIPAIEETAPVTTPVEQSIESESPILDDTQPTPPDPKMDTATDGERAYEKSTTEISSALYIYNINLSTFKNKQTVKDQNPNSASIKNIFTVCNQFTSIFPDTKEDGDLGFFGWAVKNYGLDVCIDKISYMKEHKKRHPIVNPKGFLRFALEKDYQAPKFIFEKIKADKRAELAYQHSQTMLAEMEVQKANMNYEAGAIALKNIMAMLDGKAQAS